MLLDNWLEDLSFFLVVFVTVLQDVFT